ncbi:helicase-exonuclease AddAB subunit AddA [Jutongia sp. SJQ-6]
MKPQWTADQQKVIDLRDSNILVSAAAGSGKTAVLVERIIGRITDRQTPVDIDRLLVVTFTKAAAAEMRGRIGEALQQKLEQTPDDDNLQRQIGLLHNAQITTIDSFCQHIIRNYFHVIDLDPMFQVGDETDLKIMKEAVLGEVLEQKYADARQKENQVFLDAMQMFATGRTDKEIESIVLKLYELAQSYPFPDEQLEQWKNSYALRSVEEMEQTEWMEKYIADVQMIVAECEKKAFAAYQISVDGVGLEAYTPTIQTEWQQIKELRECKTLQELCDGIGKISFGRLSAIRGNKHDKELQEQIKALRASYRDKGIEQLQKEMLAEPPEEMLAMMQQMDAPVRELVQLTIDFGKAFAEKKREDGIIDFADMEHFALQILVTRDEDGNSVPSATAKELQEYYEEIMTDEYQDSNYVQEMILTSISRGPEQSPYLFMVGDVKQSIYQFRLARPDLFMEKYHAYDTEEGGNRRIDLRQNFRSRASVLESANYIFERIMRQDFGGIAYDDAAKLVPGAVFDPCEERTADQTEIILLNMDAQEDNDFGKRELEAMAIGQKIRDMVQGDHPMYVSDKGGYRPIEYRDIVILLRSMKGWTEEFQETLADMGIPAMAPKKTGYFATLEVQTMLNLLRVIDNPRQDIPFVAVLRSPIYGLQDEELAKIAAERSGLQYLDNIWAYCDRHEDVLSEKLSDLLDTLQEYRRKAETVSVYELLREIYEETGYYALMSAMPGGEQRSANLDILLQQAIEFAENGHRGIFGFCRYIEMLKKSDIDFGEATVGTVANAVQLVSIHKSKGLEFPVVFVAGMGKQFNKQDMRKKLLLDVDYGVGANYVDLEERLYKPTVMKRFIARQMLENSLSEEVRILYVALTRAKEKLILTGTVKGLDKKLQSWNLTGASLQHSALLGAATYLDWIMPALVDRPIFGQCISHVIDGQAQNTENSQKDEKAKEAAQEQEDPSMKDQVLYDSKDQDSLFRLEVIRADAQIAGEMEQLEQILLRREALKHQDITKEYDAELAEQLRRQRKYQYPYANEQKLPVKISVTELKRRAMEQQKMAVRAEVPEDEVTEMVPGTADRQTGIEDEAVYDIPQPKFRQTEESIGAAERGTLYHFVMEHLPYEQMGDHFTAEMMLAQMQEAGLLKEAERNCLKPQKFDRFMQSELGKRMQQAAKRGALRREQQFMLEIPVMELYPELESEETVLVQGIIDACFEEDGEWVLVDYKTDYVRYGMEQTLVDRYRVQLEQYARALEQLTGMKVREQIIYSFALDKHIPVPVCGQKK